MLQRLARFVFRVVAQHSSTTILVCQSLITYEVEHVSVMGWVVVRIGSSTLITAADLLGSRRLASLLLH